MLRRWRRQSSVGILYFDVESLCLFLFLFLFFAELVHVWRMVVLDRSCGASLGTALGMAWRKPCKHSHGLHLHGQDEGREDGGDYGANLAVRISSVSASIE